MSDKLPLDTFIRRASEQPEIPYLHQIVDGAWETYTLEHVNNMARRIAKGILSQGFKKGDRIAILGRNSAEWLITDIAIMMAGMISVPIYATAGAETLSHVLRESEAKAIFIGKLDTPSIAKSVCTDILKIGYPNSEIQVDYQWGRWLMEYEPLNDIAQPAPDDVFSIVYTSGSTGTPKGVVLTYRHILAGSGNLRNIMPPGHNRILSYLPLAHISERYIVTIASIYSSMEVFFNESVETFHRDLRFANVTIFFSVPHLWNKFQKQILSKLPEGRLPTPIDSEQARKLIAYIRSEIGFSYCQLFGAGSAPISKDLLHWFKQLGIEISEGWGMTETAGPICLNIPFSADRLGTIGRPLDGIDIKLSVNGEVLVKGEQIFSEYYKNPEASRTAFDNGWFRTGDLGEITSSGDLKIIGRVKEQFKTAKGKYISPASIESKLLTSDLIDQACVIGEGRAQPIALISINNLHSKDAATSMLEKHLELINNNLEPHQKISTLYVVREAWDANSDLLTPTLKVKRRAIEERYDPILKTIEKPGVEWEPGNEAMDQSHISESV